jgi:hypothetical protein
LLQGRCFSAFLETYGDTNGLAAKRLATTVGHYSIFRMGNPMVLAPCSGEGVFTGFGLLKRATAWLQWGHQPQGYERPPFKLKTVG